MLTSILFAAAIVSDFPGGSVGRSEWVSADHVRVAVEGQSDQDGRNRQANWYYFRLDGVAGREVAITLTDLVGEYNYRPGSHAVTARTRPVFSYDNKTWTHFERGEWDEEEVELTVRFTPERDRVWVAHTPPYTTEHLGRLTAHADGHPHFEGRTVGQTVQGRPMRLWTIAAPAAEDDRPVAWLMFRQHAWETGTSWAGEGAVRFLLSDAEEAARLRREIVWKIFPMADPDGAAEGGVRFNRNGYDLNRNWDARDPELMPEIFAQHGAAADWIGDGGRVDFFLTLHNTESSEYVEGPAAHRELVDRFRAAMTRLSSFEETRDEPRDAAVSTTPGMKGRMSVNQGLHADFGFPAMLMESRVEEHPGLGGRSRNIPDWTAFGEGLVRAVAETVLAPGE